MGKKELIEMLRSEGFSEAVLLAMKNVRREDFVLPEYLEMAYLNEALPIGFGQTISQPYTIAFMLDLLDLKVGQKVLEVGSGCGYVLALISEIVGESGKVYGVEIVEPLALKSRENLKDYNNVEVFVRDGKKGLISKSLFDRVLVSASGKEIPEELFNELKDGGIMVCVIKNSIFVVEKKNGKRKVSEYPGFVFVELKS